MQREDVERLARYLDADTANDLRALLDRAERAEAEQARLARAWEAKHDSMVKQAKDHEDYFDKTQRRITELVAERDAAFAAGQEEMRERAAEQCDCALMDWEGDVLHDRAKAIRDLPIKDGPDGR